MSFPTKLLTNGILIDRTVARLVARHCESVQISFDGDKDNHERRRGAGSFDAALAGLRQTKSEGTPVSARITVGDDNCACVDALLDLLKDEIDAFHVSRVVPIANCDVRMPDVRTYRNIIYRLYAQHTSNPMIGLRDPFFGPLLNTHADRSDFCGCSAGISGMCVTPTGDIYPCRRLPIALGNISEVTLADVYFDHPLLKDLRARKLGGRCGICEHNLYCGGSRCIAFAHTGDPLAEDPGCIFADMAGA